MQRQIREPNWYQRYINENKFYSSSPPRINKEVKYMASSLCRRFETVKKRRSYMPFFLSSESFEVERVTFFTVQTRRTRRLDRKDTRHS